MIKRNVILASVLLFSAILVVAFYTFNISRIFLASSEEGTTPAVLVAAGITLSILIGASLIAAFPDIRTSSLVVGLCGVFVVILLAGSLISLHRGLDSNMPLYEGETTDRVTLLEKALFVSVPGASATGGDWVIVMAVPRAAEGASAPRAASASPGADERTAAPGSPHRGADPG